MENKIVPAEIPEISVQMPSTVFNKIPSSQENNLFQNTAMMNAIYATARIMAKSTIVPKEYQNNEGSCFIACELAARTGLSTLMVAQSLAIVYGRPSWSGQACVAIINQSRRYDKPLKIRFVDKSQNDMPRYVSGQTDGAYAYAVRGSEEFFGTVVTWKMANDEGWATKSGSKWNTMPELMFKYRAASFFAREHCPDLLFGCPVEGEAEDIHATEPAETAKRDLQIAKNLLQGVGEVVEQTAFDG